MDFLGSIMPSNVDSMNVVMDARNIGKAQF